MVASPVCKEIQEPKIYELSLNYETDKFTVQESEFNAVFKANKDSKVHQSSLFMMSNVEFNLAAVFDEKFNQLLPYPIGITFEEKAKSLQFKSYAGKPDY